MQGVMLDRLTADIICRALLAIVARLRKIYNLPGYNNIVIVLADKPEDVREVDCEE